LANNPSQSAHLWQLGNQHFPLYSQESNSEFSKVQSLLEAKKWYEADRETVSLLDKNGANLCCRNLRAMGCGCDRAMANNDC
jgi:hypothetical protein